MAGLLAGDRALVTGAGQGIGRAIALALAEHGCDVAINDVDEEGAAETVNEVRETTGARATACVGDVSDRDTADRLVAETVEAFGGLEILVNNAGIAVPQTFEEISGDDETWQRTLDVNLNGVKNCTAAAFSELCDASVGRVVNVASTAGLRISPLMGAHYTSSKWAIVGFTKHLAHETGADGIRVNAVCPGPTRTQLTERVTTQEQRAETAAGIPLGRWGEPEDVAGAAVFFASDLARHVTGAALPVDGGFTISH